MDWNKYVNKILSNLTSWKLWIWIPCFIALLLELINGYQFAGITILILGGRIAEYKWSNNGNS